MEDNLRDIEIFIKWLKKFYNLTPKQKNKMIKKVTKENQSFGNWLQSVRDFNYDMQKDLYDNLRCSGW